MRRTRIIVHNSNRSDLNFKSGPPRFGRLPPNRLGGTPPPRNFSILTLVFIGRERRVALPGKSTTAMLSVIKIIDDCWRGSVLRDPQLCSHLPFDWWRLSTNWILVVLQIPDQKCFREAGAPRPTCQNQNILKMTKKPIPDLSHKVCYYSDVKWFGIGKISLLVEELHLWRMCLEDDMTLCAAQCYLLIINEPPLNTVV